MKNVRIIEERSARKESSEVLADSLRKHFGGEIDVAVVGASAADLPEDVVRTLRIEGDRARPAMVVNGSLVALGQLPSWTEAVELVTSGQPLASARGSGGGQCCGDTGCGGV